MKLNQKGFGVVEGLLAAITITLLVGVCFYVVNANKNDEKTDKSITAQSAATEGKPLEKPKVEYVEFKDLGFKIKKTEKMNDWSYLVEPQLPTTRYVQSAAHVKAIQECNKGSVYADQQISTTSGSFMAFTKQNGVYKEPVDELVFEKLAKQFDTFYITVGYPNGGSPCFNENGAGYPVARSPEGAQEALLEALKSAEKL